MIFDPTTVSNVINFAFKVLNFLSGRNRYRAGGRGGGGSSFGGSRNGGGSYGGGSRSQPSGHMMKGGHDLRPHGTHSYGASGGRSSGGSYGGSSRYGGSQGGKSGGSSYGGSQGSGGVKSLMSLPTSQQNGTAATSQASSGSNGSASQQNGYGNAMAYMYNQWMSGQNGAQATSQKQTSYTGYQYQ